MSISEGICQTERITSRKAGKTIPSSSRLKAFLTGSSSFSQIVVELSVVSAGKKKKAVNATIRSNGPF